MASAKRGERLEERAGHKVQTSETPQLTVRELVAAVTTAMIAEANLAPETIRWRSADMARFSLFAERGLGITDIGAIKAEHVLAFMGSLTNGSRPAVDTTRVRLFALKRLFASARRLGITDSDPTLNVPVPQKSSIHTRPLEDEEIEIGEAYAADRLQPSRKSVAWALAEVSARPGEIAAIRVSDLNLQEGVVRIHGGRRTDERSGRMTPWARIQLGRRLRQVEEANEGDTLLVGDGGWSSYENARAAVSVAIIGVLKRAGLHHDPAVRPDSVSLWAAKRSLLRGATLVEAARLLGARSLDEVASQLGMDWRSGEGR